VPAARHGLNLQTAAAVARRGGRRLVILCSHACEPEEAGEAIMHSDPRVRPTILNVRDYQIPVRLECDRIAEDWSSWDYDTAIKRNLGLALAYSMGWKTVLFLDDDVRQLRREHLGRMLAALAGGAGSRAAGWAFDDYPDHSIACHGYRLSDQIRYGRQEPFIGGGALAVAIRGRLPFFPTVYNEDWLFLYPLLAEGRRSVARAGSMLQLPFDPFAHPAHAGKQEFGEVLAEGLFRLLHRSGAHDPLVRGGPATEVGFWKEMTDRRRRFLRETWTDLQSDPKASAEAECLRIALETLDDGWADALAEWFCAWQGDLVRWHDFIRELESSRPRRAANRWTVAMARLDLAERVWRIPPRRVTGARRPPGSRPRGRGPGRMVRSVLM